MNRVYCMWFFNISLFFPPLGIITSSINLASLLHCFSKPITQKLGTVITWNESRCICVPAAQIKIDLDLWRKCIKPGLFPLVQLRRDEPCSWALKPCRFTVWLSMVLLCLSVVKSPKTLLQVEDLTTTFILTSVTGNPSLSLWQSPRMETGAVYPKDVSLWQADDVLLLKRSWDLHVLKQFYWTDWTLTVVKITWTAGNTKYTHVLCVFSGSWLL